VMGGEQAAQVLLTVKRDQAAREGKQLSAGEEAAILQPIREKYETEGHPFFASARLWDDGVVDMRLTRSVLAQSLAVTRNAPVERTTVGVFRM
jgi:3-methylcrotonyl-CoA carboxylase beta subunit